MPRNSGVIGQIRFSAARTGVDLDGGSVPLVVSAFSNGCGSGVEPDQSLHIANKIGQSDPRLGTIQTDSAALRFFPVGDVNVSRRLGGKRRHYKIAPNGLEGANSRRSIGWVLAKAATPKYNKMGPQFALIN